MNRRQLLRTTGIALAAGLAGCGGSGDDGGTTGEQTTPADTATEVPTDTQAPTEAETATPTESRTATQTETETQTQTATPAGPSGSELVIDNVGVSAWEIVSDETGSVGPTNEDNPTMSFEIGTRYAVENRGWSAHPFALRTADDSPLLSQSADGSYEDDADVSWVDNGETFAFTMTESLATDLDYYICTVHANMRGDAKGV